MKVKLIVRCAITCLASIGFVTQVLQISLIYFSFRTTTKTTVVIPDELAKHRVAFCVRYRDVLDYKRLEAETNIRITDIAGNSSLTAKQILEVSMEDESKLTLKQIFDYTPKGDEIIDSCMFRPDASDIRIEEGKQCREEFTVTRFTTRELICYNISEVSGSTRENRIVIRRSVTQSTFFGHKVYEIVFSEALNNASNIQIISFHGENPVNSREFAAINNELFYDGEKRNNFFLFSPSDFYVTTLKPPFDTKCIDKAPKFQLYCYHHCITNAFWKHSRAPMWDIFREEERQYHNLSPLSILDLRDPKMKYVMKRDGVFCKKKCYFTSCQYDFTKTSTLLGIRSNIALGIAYVTPNDPDTHISAEPRMIFIDFFTYVCSCFGTWFGLSFLSLIQCSKYFLKKKSHCHRRPVTWKHIVY